MDAPSALIERGSVFVLKNTPIKQFQLSCVSLYVGYWALPEFYIFCFRE